MIKSEITPNHTETKKVYPYIGASKDDDEFIVLFHDPGRGVVIHSFEGVGYYSDDWDENFFSSYNGHITLTTEKD